MKKLFAILTVAFAVGLSSMVLEASKKPFYTVVNESSGIKVEIPQNIQVILDESCIMCHNFESKNTKGKSKLDFDKFTNGEYSAGKLMGKLNGIKETVIEGEMPPSKFLKEYPERALTEAETKTLLDWVEVQAEVLSKE